jgi:plasmid stabilization system protein ParE
MPRFVFTNRAQENLLQAWLCIADDDLATADRVVDTIEQESRLSWRLYKAALA